MTRDAAAPTIGRRLRVAAAIVAASVAAVLAIPGALGSTPARAAEPNASDCDIGPGQSLPSFWPKDRLQFDRAWPVTRGAGVLVAVIDSGLNKQFSPHLRGLRTIPGVDVIPFPGFKPNNTADCYGHGTAVTSILAAQPTDADGFVGIAPDVTVMPIKQTHRDKDGSGSSQTIGTAIDKAIDAGAQIANISITTPTPTAELERAVARAAAKNLLIVAAAGNDGDTENRNRVAYPAAYATKYPNVIAVSASGSKDQIGEFSTNGNYVTVTAPGVDVPATTAIDANYLTLSGTSFATPYVTGTAALVLASHKGMPATEIKKRIIATADPPPAAVPDPTFGYGFVNPYRAVTTVQTDLSRASSASRAAPLPAPAAAKPEDRSLQDTALTVAALLLGLLVLTIVTTAVLRRRTTTSEASPARELEPVRSRVPARRP